MLIENYLSQHTFQNKELFQSGMILNSGKIDKQHEQCMMKNNKTKEG